MIHAIVQLCSQIKGASNDFLLTVFYSSSPDYPLSAISTFFEFVKTPLKGAHAVVQTKNVFSKRLFLVFLRN
jgi:hypothetical protein